jgi:hypothetical protein
MSLTSGQVDYGRCSAAGHRRQELAEARELGKRVAEVTTVFKREAGK